MTIEIIALIGLVAVFAISALRNVHMGAPQGALIPAKEHP